ncbi:type II toxin-antitoxin system Phd/YefM family antitoxin [Thermodesulfobacteriota bacterium]
MEKDITATEAVREFSEILNHVKFKGDHFIVKRSGKPVAKICPIEREKTPLKELKSMIAELPKLGKELDNFSSNLKDISNVQPSLPQEKLWGDL